MNPVERYIELLETHDWFYQFSDDHSVWKRGDDEYNTIMGLKAQLDPDGSIFNQYKPEDY